MSDSVADGRAGRRPETSVGRIGLTILLGLSVAALVSSLTTLEVGTLAEPGPGLWIALVSGTSVGLCIAALLVAAVARDDVSPLTRSELGRLLAAAPALILGPALLQMLGPSIAVLIVSFYWLKVPMRQSWLRTVVTACALTAGIYVVFVLLLRVPFPTGTLTGI